MSATHTLSANSGPSNDPLRHNYKPNGVIAQNKVAMAYSPLAIANSINVNNNNSHINNNHANIDNTSPGSFG